MMVDFERLSEGEKIILIEMNKGIYSAGSGYELDLFNLVDRGYIKKNDHDQYFGFTEEGKKRTNEYWEKSKEIILNSLGKWDNSWKAEIEISRILNLSVGIVEIIFLETLLDEGFLIKEGKVPDAIYKIKNE